MAVEEYVLGTGIDELERLALQHRGWADEAVGSWKRAGIRPGSHVLDLGGGLDSTAAWVLGWWRLYAPKLVPLGKISQETCDQAMRDLDVYEKDPDQFFVCPAVYEFIAKKES